MIEKCSIGNMNNNLQNITLIILILILIIVILFYIRNSSLKHDELVEKYTTISTNVINRTPDISHNGPFPDTNRLSFFSTSGTAVTLRPCQVKFNDDGSSKYEYQDDWQEIAGIHGGEVPVKIIGRDNTTNANTFTNFSENSRCFKELSSTDTYKYKYLNNDLIQYDKNNYVSLTSNINGVPVAKNYMEMKFDVFGSNINHFDNIRNSICSLNYSKTLKSEDNSSTLGNTELYRLKLTNDRDNKIENIEKITIDPADNHVFNKNTSFEVANLIGANTGIYKYDTASKLFVFEPRNASVSNDIRTINLYQFERNLFCDKQEIKSYKKLNNAKIDMIKIINYDVPPPTFFPDTKIPDRYITENRYSTYISNIRKENSLTEVKGYLNDLIMNELNILNTATSNILQEKRDANQILIDRRKAFIEPSNNSKGNFIQNAIIKNNYDDDKNKYKLLLSKDYYDLGFGDVTYSSYTINEGHSSIVVNSGDEPILKEFVSATGSGTQDVWEVKVFKENDTFILPVNTTCDILIVGGGGGGSHNHGGGGGAGAVVFIKSVVLNSGSYTINVGAGGAKGTRSTTNFGGLKGNDSKIIFNGKDILKAEGGGGGGQGNDTGSIGNGGSGGGGDAWRDSLYVVYNNGVVGTGSIKDYNGTTGVLYGNNGGSHYLATGGIHASRAGAGGGGGGAGQIGSNATKVNVGGNGGNGVSSATINGITYNFVDMFGTTYGTNNDNNSTTRYFGGGGGGSIWGNPQGVAPVGDIGSTNINGSGGKGGGGMGALGTMASGANASANTGGGGGGGGWGTDDSSVNGGDGGSGIVIIKVISPTTNKYLFFNYLPAQTNYTLTFPVRTLVDVNNNNNLILQGQYNVSLGTTNSSIIPSVFNTSNRLIPLPNTSTSNISVRYHLLNPIKTAEGAQWTYSSSNANVYHLGSVGIGTTSPEYSLDVRGFIYSSSGGYTSSALTKWSVLSDRRIKENIVKASYDKCLDNVKNIELYNFNFKNNYVNTNDRHQLGFIAQEVQQVYPKAVEVSRMIMNLEEKIDDLLTLNTTQIDYTLYGAVKCLIQKLENIKIKMEQIKTVYNITT
jgi:hypothetical protein